MSSDVSVVAIVAAFNEADVIGPVVQDLIEQGVLVYFLDDGSTDGTAAIVEPFVGRGVIGIERLREPAGDHPPGPFDWERLLLRKAALAHEIGADWFIHHDADEFRESPWADRTLKDAIGSVDALGFNAIDFLNLDFWPVHDDFRAGGDVRQAFTFFAEGAPYNRLQIRCWKKTDAPVDLASSGGHDAQFPGRRVFPLRFISRHYPIRGQAHGERKIFHERRNRLRQEERARGWHVHYDLLHDGASVIQDRAALTPYDAHAIRVGLALRHRGVEELEAALDEVRALAEVRRVELEKHRTDLEAQRLRLEENRRELEARTGELDEARSAIATLHDLADHQARNIHGLEGAVRERERMLVEAHRSWSWRLTSPARAAYRMLRRR